MSLSHMTSYHTKEAHTHTQNLLRLKEALKNSVYCLGGGLSDDSRDKNNRAATQGAGEFSKHCDGGNKLM